MTTIQLCIERLLQGTFAPRHLNLLFIFQVNCPGCFVYGFPLVNQLYLQYRDSGLNVLGIATAFEDFDKNTPKNAQLLLTEKQTIGETKKAIGGYYLQSIHFPIAVDYLMSNTKINSPEYIQTFRKSLTKFNQLSEQEQDGFCQEMKIYLQKTQQASATFALNQLPGTPTFLLLDQNLKLLKGWLGYVDETIVINFINSYLASANMKTMTT